MAAVAKHTNEAAMVRVANGADQEWGEANKGSMRAFLDHVDEPLDEPEPATDPAPPELTLSDARKILSSSKWAEVRLVKAKRLSSIEEELLVAMALSVKRS